MVSCSLDIHPALIAAIISRQSEAGTKLNNKGYGLSDPNCYGLMQVYVDEYFFQPAQRGHLVKLRGLFDFYDVGKGLVRGLILMVNFRFHSVLVFKEHRYDTLDTGRKCRWLVGRNTNSSKTEVEEMCRSTTGIYHRRLTVDVHGRSELSSE